MVRYKINSGVEKIKSKYRKYVISVGAGILVAGAAAVPAFAIGSGAGDGSNASPCGAAHGAFADKNGNFGFLGQAGGTPGYHNGAVGQDPGATGSNNSNSTCNQ
jgi:hypothetical protein